MLNGVIPQVLASNDQAHVKEMSLEAEVKIKEFSQQLKGALSHAIQTKGLETGIEVCHQQAPKIASELSSEGWRLSRTSLKTRNSKSIPNDRQQKVLLNFQQQLKSGKPVGELVYTEKTQDSFIMMKAIPTSELCLLCHGKAISPSIKDKIKHYYPNDTAIQYDIGDIRGAFVVEKSLSIK